MMACLLFVYPLTGIDHFKISSLAVSPSVGFAYFCARYSKNSSRVQFWSIPSFLISLFTSAVTKLCTMFYSQLAQSCDWPNLTISFMISTAQWTRPLPLNTLTVTFLSFVVVSCLSFRVPSLSGPGELPCRLWGSWRTGRRKLKYLWCCDEPFSFKLGEPEVFQGLIIFQWMWSTPPINSPKTCNRLDRR